MSNEKVNHDQIMAELQAELLLIQDMSDAESIEHGIDREAALKSVQDAMMAVDHIDGIEDIKGIT